MRHPVLAFAALACATVALFLWSAGRTGAPSPDRVRTLNGVRMEEIPLSAFTPAVPALAASAMEQAPCRAARARRMGRLAMELPAGPGGTRTVSVMLDSAGAPFVYSEMRMERGATTSIAVDLRDGTGGGTNITEGGARVTIARGTADEALNSAALGTPARTIQRMLARCAAADSGTSGPS